MRMYPVIPGLLRRADNDYVIPGHPNMKIEKNTSVLIPVSGIHFDPAIYPNPETFNPANFTPEKVKERESVSWLSFGEGSRNCIGLRFGQMQTRLGLAILLRNFKFTIGPNTEIPVKINKSHHLCIADGSIFLRLERIRN